VMNMKKIFFLFLLFCTQLHAHLSLSLSDVTYEKNKEGKRVARVDRDDEFELNVTISDESENKEAELNGLEHFDITSQRSGHSMTFINGKSSSKITRSYTLRPREQGEFTISSQEGASVIVHVQQETEASTAPGTFDGKTSCQLLVSREDVVVGEPLTVTVRLYCGDDVAGNIALSPLSGEGFVTKELKGLEKKEVSFDDKPVTIVEKRYQLTPISSGEKQIEPIKVEYHSRQATRRGRHPFVNDSFFSSFFEGQSLKQKCIPKIVELVGSISHVVINLGTFRSHVLVPIIRFFKITFFICLICLGKKLLATKVKCTK